MAIELDKTVRHHLQMHLAFSHHKSEAWVLKIGTEEQLRTAVKIEDSKEVEKCFNQYNFPIAYPELSPKKYLVACVDQHFIVDVFGIYSLAQMTELQERLGSPKVRHIYWKVLTIPEELESELLKDMDLERGIILQKNKIF